MSIASEYAKRIEEVKQLKAPEFDASPRPGGGQNGSVFVDEYGYLETRGFSMTAKQALQFADWIYKTFGDEE